MTDGQLVKLDSGAVAQVKRVCVAGVPYATTVLLAVTVPAEPPAEPPTKH